MNAASLLSSYLVNAVWQAAVVVGAGWIASRALSRVGPRAEHIGWVSTLAVAVVAPAAQPLRALSRFLIHPSGPVGHLTLIFAAAPEASPAHAGLYQWPVAAIWLLAVLYFVALLYFSGRIVRSLYSVRAMIRSARPLTLTLEQEEIWTRCRRSFQLNRALILCSAKISSPVVAGLRKPVLILPTGFAARCAAPDLLAALAHECAHARRRDFQKNLFYEAISLLLAFHPAVWFMKAHIAQTREMICDSMVAETILEPRNYAQSLLRLAAMVVAAPRTASANAIGIFDANILEKRVMMMNRKKSHFGLAVRYGLIIPAALLLGSSGIIAAAKSIVIQPQSAADQSGKAEPYGHVYKIGKHVSAPIAIYTPEAEFSAEARRAKYQGICVIKMIVDAQGNPRNAHVVRRLGMGLDEKALEAVRKYKFKPAMRDGQPVAVAVTTEVNFKLY